MKFNVARNIIASIAALAVLVTPAVALAANTPTLNQTINAGTLSTDILQSDDSTPVAAPVVNFPALNRDFSCQTNTATLGDTNNRVYVTNLADPGSVTGWTLSIAATSGPGTVWDTGTYDYEFDNPAGSGCTGGQLTVDPSVATLTLNCNSICNSAGITQGSSTAFDNGTTDSITLMQNSNGDAWRGYLTGIGLSQEVPGGQENGSYSIGMTISVVSS